VGAYPSLVARAIAFARVRHPTRRPRIVVDRARVSLAIDARGVVGVSSAFATAERASAMATTTATTCNGASCVRFTTTDKDIYLGCVSAFQCESPGRGAREGFGSESGRLFAPERAG